MKNILLISFLTLYTFAHGQQYVVQYKPVDSKIDWGYMDENGSVLIAPTYKGTFDFCEEGYAPVFDLDTDKWAYIDIEGNELPVALEGYVPNNIMGYGRTGFVEGLATVVVKKKKGVINLKGEVVFKPEFNFISVYNNGFSTAKIGRDFYVIDNAGKKIFLTYSVLSIKRFSEGLAGYKGKSKLYGYVNTKGLIEIEPQFYGIGHFVDGIAWAKREDKKIGFINKKGEWVIEPSFSGAKDFDPVTGLARVKSVSGWHFISKDGVEIRAEGALAYGDFHDGLAFAKKGDKFGFINAKGEWAVEAVYVKVKNFSNGFAAVRSGDKWGFIDAKGNLIFKEEARAIRDFSNGFAAISDASGLWGVINSKGEWVVKPIHTKIKDVQIIK